MKAHHLNTSMASPFLRIRNMVYRAPQDFAVFISPILATHTLFLHSYAPSKIPSVCPYFLHLKAFHMLFLQPGMFLLATIAHSFGKLMST